MKDVYYSLNVKLENIGVIKLTYVTLNTYYTNVI